MTVSFWKPRNTNQRRLRLVDYAIVWLMITLTVAGVAPRLVASLNVLISAS